MNIICEIKHKRFHVVQRLKKENRHCVWGELNELWCVDDEIRIWFWEVFKERKAEAFTDEENALEEENESEWDIDEDCRCVSGFTV